MHSICDTQQKIFGCQEVCEKRVANVFGDADSYEQSAFMTLSRPDCEDLCNGDLYFFDLIEDNDSRKKRALTKPNEKLMVMTMVKTLVT